MMPPSLLPSLLVVSRTSSTSRPMASTILTELLPRGVLDTGTGDVTVEFRTMSSDICTLPKASTTRILGDLRSDGGGVDLGVIGVATSSSLVSIGGGKQLACPFGVETSNELSLWLSI